MDDFKVSWSIDGKTWTRMPEADDANYFWVARQAKRRSIEQKRYEKVERDGFGEIVTFFNGMAITSASATNSVGKA